MKKLLITLITMALLSCHKQYTYGVKYQTGKLDGYFNCDSVHFITPNHVIAFRDGSSIDVFADKITVEFAEYF